MCRPRWRSHEIALGVRFITANIDELTTGQTNLRRTGGISATRTPLQHVCGGQQLSAMAEFILPVGVQIGANFSALVGYVFIINA